MQTLRLLLAARDERIDVLAERLDEEAERATATLGAGSRALGLVRIENDPFDAQYPGSRKFDGVLAVDPPETLTADALIDVVRGADERWNDLVHPDLSGALIGSLRRITGTASEAAPFRFIYLMRHKAGQNTAQFQKHWGGPHAEFGRRTQGIRGYDQLHVDAVASRAAARGAGFGVYAMDGVPALHMDSVEDFITAAVGSPDGNGAIEDEKSFVDARNSVGFVCRVVARHG